MDIAPIPLDAESLAAYAALFAACFPNSEKFSIAYLAWLYRDNPHGQAIGFDARDGATLAAHYVCIPVAVKLHGGYVRAMLSLNTATHPQYQGRGLFTRLAEQTYTRAAELGIVAVCGVANGNSTPGFTRKLGFTLIEPLQAAVGAGRLAVPPAQAAESAGFRYDWSREALAWRCANPTNRVAVRLQDGYLQCVAKAAAGMLHAYAELPAPDFALPETQTRLYWSMPRLFLGLVPGQTGIGSYWSIPQRLRPSPLNFIFRALSKDMAAPGRGEISLSFLDFDAY
jgi:GNAT superfamily N-acetyltransferase